MRVEEDGGSLPQRPGEEHFKEQSVQVSNLPVHLFREH